MTEKTFSLTPLLNSEPLNWPVSHFTNQIQLRGLDFLNSLKDQLPGLNSLDYKSDNDHIIDMLTMGLLWHNYHAYLSSDALFYAPLFHWLRPKNNTYPETGFSHSLIQAALLKKRNKSINVIERFEYLTGWLKATNEFNDEHKRIKSWQFVVEQMPVIQQELFWVQVLGFTDWFIALSKDYRPIGYETIAFNDPVSTSLEQSGNDHKMSEYQLQQVAIELLNNDFLSENIDSERFIFNIGQKEINRVNELSYP